MRASVALAIGLISCVAGWTSAGTIKATAERDRNHPLAPLASVGLSHPVHVTLVLTRDPRAVETLKELHFNVSEPGHPQRAQYLHPDEIARMLAPPNASVTAVLKHITAANHGDGVTDTIQHSPGGDVIRFTSTVGAVSKHLDLTCGCGKRRVRRSSNGRRKGAAASQADHVLCTPTGHPVGGPRLAEHLWHAEAVAAAVGGSCEAAAQVHASATRARKDVDPLTMLATQLPAACFLNPLTAAAAPCGADPNAKPLSYTRAQLPPPSLAVDWLAITPGASLSASSTITSIILWPYCWGELEPMLMPLAPQNVNGASAAHLWRDKLNDPCGIGSAGKPVSYTICLEPTSSSPGESTDCFTLSANDPNLTCASIPETVCVAGANVTDFSSWTTQPYTHSYCTYSSVTGRIAKLGVEYYVRTTMTLADGSNHSTYASTTVPESGPRNLFATQRRTTMFRTELKLPAAMRAWYHMNSSDVASASVRPNAFGILQYPSTAGGSYGMDDLEKYLAAGNVPNSAALMQGVQFVSQPNLTAIGTANLNAAVHSVNGTTRQNVSLPCSVQNNPAMCDCGTKPAYGGESTLDVQQMVGASQGGYVYAFRSGYWTSGWVGASEFSSDLYSTLDVSWAALYGAVVPQTLSFSYGTILGACNQDILPRPFGDIHAEGVMVNVSDLYFMALGVAGTSVLASSGDKGAHEGCEFSVLNAEGGCGAWVTSYPAVSVYVTAVGGTEFIPATNVTYGQPGCRLFGGANAPFQNTTCVEEAVISIGIAGGITSGGGFANTTIEHYSSLPQWQATAVGQYLNRSGPGSYAVTTGRNVTPAASSLGRGYPDISGFAGNIGVVVDGLKSGSGGTSASSPFMAGVIGVLNTQLIRAGKGYLGFLNPTLYQAYTATNGSAFNDVKKGNINCRGQNSPGNSICCATGYSAGLGWDPASGLGSINFPILRDHVLTTMPNVATAPFRKPTPASGAQLCPLASSPYLGTPCPAAVVKADHHTLLLGILIGVVMIGVCVYLVTKYRRSKETAYSALASQEDAGDEGHENGQSESDNDDDMLPPTSVSVDPYEDDT